MCQGSPVWQVPVDEEAVAAAAQAAAVAGAAEEDAAEAAQVAEEAAAAEAAMRERMARVRMRWAAALLSAAVRGLSDLVTRTGHSRAMLGSAIDLLHEAAEELDLPFSAERRIMAPVHECAAVFQLPVPGPIDAARRIAGRLCGVLPPARYMQICECLRPLAHIGDVNLVAYGLLKRCAELLDLTDQSPWVRRWRRRMDYAAEQPKAMKLFDAHKRARTAHSHLLTLVEFWRAEGVARIDRVGALLSAEEDLRVAMDLMDQALTAMNGMHGALKLQASELT